LIYDKCVTDYYKFRGNNNSFSWAINGLS